jgi:hypothetical protein
MSVVFYPAYWFSLPITTTLHTKKYAREEALTQDEKPLTSPTSATQGQDHRRLKVLSALRTAMDQRRIVLMNLAKGELGGWDCRLIGLLLTKQLFQTPWRDGTTHVVLEPLDFIARLPALVPPPRRHLTRYHGVLAPHSSLRALITLAGRGKGSNGTASTAQGAEQPWRPCHVAMRWAQRLKRVFGIEIDTCARCGARLMLGEHRGPRGDCAHPGASGKAQPQRAPATTGSAG